MAWIYLDDHLDEHPKFINLSARAAWLYVRGLMYCSRHLTAGHIPKGALSAAYDQRTYSKISGELQHAMLWERMENGGIYVHDYATWNAAQLVRRQKAKSAAQARWKQHLDDAPSNAPSNAQPDASEHTVEQCSSHALEPKNQRTKEQQQGFTITKDGIVDHPAAAPSTTQSLKNQLIATIATRRVIAAQPNNPDAYKVTVVRALQREPIERLQGLANQPAHKQREPNEAARRDYDAIRPNCDTCNGSGWTMADDNTWTRCTHQTAEQEPF